MTEQEMQARIQAYEPVRPDDVVAAHERALEMGRARGIEGARIAFDGETWVVSVSGGRALFPRLGFGPTLPAAMATLSAELAPLPRVWTEAEVLATLGIEPAEARAA